jgi:pterin-4a-carbinolamine dehydratase
MNSKWIHITNANGLYQQFHFQNFLHAVKDMLQESRHYEAEVYNS